MQVLSKWLSQRNVVRLAWTLKFAYVSIPITDSKNFPSNKSEDKQAAIMKLAHDVMASSGYAFTARNLYHHGREIVILAARI